METIKQRLRDILQSKAIDKSIETGYGVVNVEAEIEVNDTPYFAEAEILVSEKHSPGDYLTPPDWSYTCVILESNYFYFDDNNKQTYIK